MNEIKFGEHLIFDAYGCNPDRLGNMELCFDVLNKLAEMAEMRKFHEPYVLKAEGNETLGGKDPGGFSGILMVHESHISIHTFEKRGFVTIDLYSCKKFPSEGIVEYLRAIFEPEDVSVIKMDRGLKYPAENIY
ncbi:MAG: adenosylmethionine decarboxylase [Patescibacteria group bacterium]